MTDAEQQELFARLERLERSNWRWKVLATVLGVVFLLLLSLGVVSAVAMQARNVAQLRMAIEAEQRARMAAEEKATGRMGVTTRVPAPSAPKQMPREPAPGETP